MWCHERQVDPFTAPVNLVVEFLTELYHQGTLASGQNAHAEQTET